jgi:glutaminyl-tRNA synthetase
MGAEETVEELAQLGIARSQAQQWANAPKVSSAVFTAMEEGGVRSRPPENPEDRRRVANLLATLALNLPAHALPRRAEVAQLIASGQIASQEQLSGALSALSDPSASDLSSDQLQRSAGVGVVVSHDDVVSAVRTAFNEHQDSLFVRKSAKPLYNALMGRVKELQPWAPGRDVKAEIDRQAAELLGDAADEANGGKKPGKKKGKKSKGAAEAPAEQQQERCASETTTTSATTAKADANGNETSTSESERDIFAGFDSPEANTKPHTAINWSDGSVQRPSNTKEQLRKHLERTGGRIVTRFPPEPNGYLHIGHAKAMEIDFGFARDYGGGCYLRYDDTNPEAEKEEYIQHIEEITRWLGHEPCKITFSSDYFTDLYYLAVRLIRRGKAYVCHQTGNEIHQSRQNNTESPWRNRLVSENLRLFEEMRRGVWDEGTATLRMKQDMCNEAMTMYDLIAYRIKLQPHPRTGRKWCIYPSYDFTHCVVDSIENITHSLCTVEFESRRPSFFWLLDELELYMPVVYEFARTSITSNVLSKRKLNKLIDNGYIDGWDDPRILTLSGLRRRGTPPDAINAFVRSTGLTKNDCVLPLHSLEHNVRSSLSENAPRAMGVLDPLEVTITNMPEGSHEHVTCLMYPQLGEGRSPTYSASLTRTVYIERSDFRRTDKANYYGLAPNKRVMLRYAYPLTCTDVRYASDGETPLQLFAEYEPSPESKPKKGVLHWVSEPRPGVSPARAEVRLYNELFQVENPEEHEDWMTKLNPNSRFDYKNAIMQQQVAEASYEKRFQLERNGYFVLDPKASASQSKLVLNRIVTLKQSASARESRA